MRFIVRLERWLTPLRTATSHIWPDAKGGSRRLRLEVPGALGNPLVAAEVQSALQGLHGVRQAKVNLRSGRVLVLLDTPSEELASEVKDALAKVVDPTAPPPPSLRRFAKRGAEAIRQALDQRRRAALASTSSNGRHPWHAESIEDVIAAFDTSPTEGLSPIKAAAELRRVGPNVLTGIPRRTNWQILAGQIFTVPTALLGGAMGLSLLLGDVLEASAILFVVGTNVAIGYFTEARAEELLHAFRELRADQATVVRGGREMRVDASELVPGDLIVLRQGQLIPADARLIEVSDEFATDESTLTGESTPVEKSVETVPKDTPLADRVGMVYAATSVATGSAKAIVVATGSRTEVGAIERALAESTQRAAPLEKQLDQLGKTLAGLSLASAAAVVGLGFLRRQPLQTLARSAVALGVAAIPEGVPTVGTTALALASQRLRQRGIVIRRLAAAETLGAISVICADKTGTLTENRMRVAELYVPKQGSLRVEWSPSHDTLRLLRPDGSEVPAKAVHDLSRIAALNADVDVTPAGEVVKGSGTEQALVEFAMAAGYPVPWRRRQARRVREQRRSAELPMMVTVHEHPELGVIELAKGAPEPVVERCEDLSPREREEILARNDEMASRGLRVLAFAWRRDGHRDSTEPLVFAGLIGLRDPPRAGAKEALATFAKAGIETQMLTGDQARTAAAIGEELGIPPARIRSRVTSTDKLAIVRALQAEGRMVAMTGDGVNDGPALQAADVGVAMGKRGTSIARAVADVVLATDDLPSLAAAVEEGRTLYDNVRRAIEYLVATNMSEVAVMLLGSLAGVFPLGPLQLLWLNVLTDIAPALALAAEPSEPDVMTRPPRDPNVPLFGPNDYRRLGLQSGAMAAVTLASYGIGASRRGAGAYASTMAFASLMTAQLLHTRRCRSKTKASHRNLDLVLAGSFALQAIALGLPGLRSALGTARLSATDLAIALALGIVPSMRPEEKLLGRFLRSQRSRGEIVLERRRLDVGSGLVGAVAKERSR